VSSTPETKSAKGRPRLPSSFLTLTAHSVKKVTRMKPTTRRMWLCRQLGTVNVEDRCVTVARRSSRAPFIRRETVARGADSSSSCCGGKTNLRAARFIATAAVTQWQIRGGGGLLGSDEPPRASHHCIKLPSIKLSWQNILLLSVTGRHYISREA